VIDVQMRRLDPKDFDAQLAAIDAHIAVGDYEQTKAALTSGLALYERFFGDETKRAALEKRLRATHREVPSGIQAGFITGMAEAAVKHGDTEKARTLLAAVMVFLESAPQWHPEERVAFEARLAGLHARAGVEDEARMQMGRIEKFHSESRDRIESNYRAAPLRAIAEAWVTIGDRAEAARVYRMAVEAGAENPNARPRAVDLAGTCCSMVRSRFLPDAILSARIDAIEAGLTDPW
jgi:ATP/maltotriose-dependent transcriptional regulator MalT